jgi:hypothetical protein
VAIAILTAALAGYVLHRVMHSERFPVLSRAHMIRHFELYGPTQSMRSKKSYRRAGGTGEHRDGVGGTFSDHPRNLLGGNVGVACGLEIRGIGFGHPAWLAFMFSYLHDRMHLEKFWMARVPLLRIVVLIRCRADLQHSLLRVARYHADKERADCSEGL